MTDPIIAPAGAEWPNLATLGAQIAAWEQTTGLRLPASYRDFLLRYDGGQPYPNVFDVGVPDAVWGIADKQTFVDPLYDFAFAVNMFNGETYGAGTPRPFFFIGCNPGGLEILISLRAQDAGAIYCWFGSDVPWETGTNTSAALYLQAPSFGDFIRSLYDTEDEIGMDHWESPRNKLLAQPLIVT
ncbi:MAG: SMI1/KNR4 family protein [Rhodobacteraceae bacterium]|nr:SMI1/KNR4 family protein [Paracoccaceae bacterium]